MKLHLPNTVPSIRIPTVNRPHPYRDWYVLMLVGGAFLAVSIGWNVWFFVRATKAEPIGAELTSPEQAPEDVITKARRVFETRAVEEGRYRSEYRFIDPS